MTLRFTQGPNRVSVGPVFTAETNCVFTVGPNCIYTRTLLTLGPNCVFTEDLTQ